MQNHIKGISKEIVYLDLFSGTGGFALGLKQAGFKFKKHYFSEIDKYAAANYQYHFSHAQGLGDIKNISGGQIERPDVITFGSPCQDISIAGDRKGLGGKKSGLFYEAIRLIRIYKPRVFVFENVKGLFSSNKGKDFEAVLRAFADIGLYDCQWQLVNTSWFLPQSRERLYLVGHLSGTAKPQIFPVAAGSRLSETGGGKGQRGKDIASTITSTYRKGVHGRGDTYVRSRNRKLRRLTPIECERLQGFPDDWTKYGLFDGVEKEISDYQRYNMLGNAVSVAVVKAIAKGLLYNKNYLGRTDMIYPDQPEIVLGSTAEVNIPELNITYSRSTRPFLGTVFSAKDVAAFIRSTFYEGEIEVQEHFVVLYLNTAKEIIGYYRHSKGTINATMVDMRIILSAALKCLATGIIVAHNHPSGSTNPSEADSQITRKLKAAGQNIDVMLLDHVIVTRDGYYSFADNGMSGLERLVNKRGVFVEQVKLDLLNKKPHTKRTLERMAAGMGIGDQTEVKELTELAIVETARSIALEEKPSVEEKYGRIVSLYKSQVNLSHRTSQSILLQQYSTPAPIGYVMGIFCKIDQLKAGGYGFEPSAGNGLLTIAAKPERVYVNEIDAVRNRNLKTQGYADVWQRDATKPFTDVRRNFMAVMTNPPFGMMDTKMVFDGYPIQPLEHVMTIMALDCMASEGRAAIIIGGHTGWDKKGRIQAGKNRLFFNYLYHHYHVADVIQINGKQLYSRQGTSFNTRLILIAGRKEKPEGAAPVHDSQRDAIVHDFDELFIRVMDAMQYDNTKADKQLSPEEANLENMKNEAQKLLQALRSKSLSGMSHSGSNYEQRYLEEYLPMQEEHNGAIILYFHDGQYEIYGRDTGFLNHFLFIPPATSFSCDGEEIPLTFIPVKNIPHITSSLRKMGYRFILTNDEGMSFPVNRSEYLYADKQIYELTQAGFLKSEEREYKKQTARSGKPFNYDLPYKPEYVAMFNMIFSGEAYEHSELNPYCLTGIGRLHHAEFRKECLVAIHSYEARLAMSISIVLSEQVLKDYPRLKLKQDARITYNKTLVTAGNQLNGSHAPRQLDFDAVMDVIRESGTSASFRLNQSLKKGIGTLASFDNKSGKAKEDWYARYKRSLYYQKKYPPYYIIVISDGDGLYEAFGNSALMLSPRYMEIRYDGQIIDYFVFGASELDHYKQMVRKELLGIIVIADPIDVSDDSLGAADSEKVPAKLDFDSLHKQFEERRIKFPDSIIIFETPLFYCAFDEQAEQIATTFHRPLIKILRNGEFRFIITAIERKSLGICLSELENNGLGYLIVPRLFTISGNAEDELITGRISGLSGNLGAPYEPVSNACIVLDTQVPDSMAYETHEALAQIKEAVGGDVDNFVRDRLGYPHKTALCKALSAEQTDAVMMAIYNIEARGQGMIIGDQTGIGKGRVAAAMIRYACHQGLKPVFLTEKANLFSDIYRDLYAIGSGRLKPFIINGRESKTDIKDEDGNVIFQALPYGEQQQVFSGRTVPPAFDFVVATYSQFNSPEKKPEKPAFLSAVGEDTVFVMDEAHNSSGSSNTGNFLQGIVSKARGVVFLSATFAKRPDNMPIYAMKTAISDCNMSRDELVESIQRGGVALQEVLSSQLVAEGQMLRRERSFEGIEVNYITLTEKAVEHQAIADNITGIVRDIIAFQKDFIDVVVEELDTIAVAEGKQVDLREGTSQAGVDNMPYFSKVFNIINQMLFSIKASSVAERAIDRLKEGKKPIIAFASTMGSFVEDMEDENGLPVADGSTINPDFSEVLRRGLDGVMRYTEKDMNGEPEYKKFEVSELSPEGQAEYKRINKRIEEISTGITLSPIDVVIKKIRDAGYSVAEVTGRKFELQMNWNGSKALVMARKRINTNDAFRQFNNNEVDVLMINQSGSTGASAHAIPTIKVSKEEVRQRVMIVLQAELDINTEVQKRGRINRTGQIIKPIYDYMTSAIPAENRLMMMLQKKLKSLDANTASNQKQSTKILDVPDFLNKYGDRVVKEYLLENPNVNRLLDDPLRLKNTTDSDQGDAETMENAAHKVSGRVAVLSVQMQQEFYTEITDRYSDYVGYLQQIGEYDLELEAMNLEAETLSSKVVRMGSGNGSLFSEDSILETVKANVLKKPFTATELDNLLSESLQGEDPKKAQQEIINDYNEETGMALEIEEKELQERFNEMDKRIYLEKKYQKLKTDRERDDYEKLREQQIEEGRQKALKVLQEKAASRKFYLTKIFRFFYVGRSLNYPIDSFEGYKEYIPTVFLGFVIDWKRKNPFLPSKIKLRFALASSNKYFAIPASYDDIEAIIGASSDVPELTREQILLNWSNYVQDNNADRKTRHIITGNLLQAFSDYKGKLVNYTTNDGKINKGILLPENWAADEQVQDTVSIPVIKALPIIKSLVTGKSITTSTGIGFLRQPEWFKIIVPMSRKAAGDIYLDKELLALVDTNNFNRVSDKMVGMLDEKRIDKFVEIIQDKHNCAVTITRHQFNTMEKQSGILRRRKPIRLPEPEREYEPDDNDLEILELEAEALKLKLRLKLRLAA